MRNERTVQVFNLITGEDGMGGKHAGIGGRGIGVVVFIALAAVGALAGCATFEGEIPVDVGLRETEYISPGIEDGIKDTLQVALAIPEAKGLRISGYRFVVSDGSGTEVFSSGESVEKPKGIAGWFVRPEVSVPESVEWNGRDGSGELVPEGEYAWHAEAWDLKGNRGETASYVVVVDNTPPSVRVSAPFLIISPDGDGHQDLLPVSQREGSIEELWTGTIRDSEGRIVRSFRWEGIAADFEWDGGDDAGKRLPDGGYSYTVAAEDRAGNSASFELAGIRIDTRKSTAAVKAALRSFSPNGDGTRDVVTFFPSVQVATDIVSSVLSVVDERGTAVARTEASGALPKPLVFTGLDEGGKSMPEGYYYGVLTVRYRNGDSPEAVSERVHLDVTPPTLVVRTQYSTFSPDGDGRKDTLRIQQDSSSEETWEAAILDRAGKVVVQRTYEERILPFDWDGRDASGNLVPDGIYRYRAGTTDSAGNLTVKELTNIVVDTRPTPVSIVPADRAFSPNGDGRFDSVRFFLRTPVPDGIEAWTVEILDAAGEPVRTYRGGEGPVTEDVVWDGKDEAGEIREGLFKARFTVSYDKGNLSVHETETPVLLDGSGPRITLNLKGIPFSPDGDGVNDLLTIGITMEDPSPVLSWNADIVDPAGTLFFSFSGKGKPAPLVWDGRSAQRELVQSAEDYHLSVTAFDSVGNRGSASMDIPVDVLVMREGAQFRIIISSVYFKPYTADYMSLEPDVVARNLKTLDRLAEVLKKYPAYRIRLEGHAVRVYWDQPDRWKTEEAEVLMPLSLLRAAVIRDALAERGIDLSRMSITGFGGYRPVVPHGDEVNRWKNRRVEFVLTR